VRFGDFGSGHGSKAHGRREKKSGNSLALSLKEQEKEED
jgi:hypothetical protein